jgi:hypothetical protein
MRLPFNLPPKIAQRSSQNLKERAIAQPRGMCGAQRDRNAPAQKAFLLLVAADMSRCLGKGKGVKP